MVPNVPILGVEESILPVVNPTTEVPVISNVQGFCTGSLNVGRVIPPAVNIVVPVEVNACTVSVPTVVTVPPVARWLPGYRITTIPDPPLPPTPE